MTTETPAARRVSLTLATLASLTLLANCLLNSPARFSEVQQKDTSILKHVIDALALGGVFPTNRGVEIRNLIFYAGAALLLLIAGLRLFTSDTHSRFTTDDLFDLRAHAKAPYFWWALMLMVAVLTSVFSHAPDFCKGPVIIHFLHFAWWLPLAIFLCPRHVRPLTTMLLTAIALTALMGIWYHIARDQPGARFLYPIGNEIWFGAILLPALFIAAAAIVSSLKSQGVSLSSWRVCVSACWRFIILAAIVLALYFTHARSALMGLCVGALSIPFLLVDNYWRKRIVLIALILAVGGASYFQTLRTGGQMGDRAHSIRTRLNYEWPYALRLFFEKPVGGWGDGCYAMLAGQFARQDQLDDPSTMSFDGQHWTLNAHNEYLELLADLGLTGAVAFLLALIMTLVVAVRYCDRLRDDPGAVAKRWLVVGLAAALVAMMAEEVTNVAMRQPGFPPIFLTIWACLWALVRDSRPSAYVHSAFADESNSPALQERATDAFETHATDSQETSSNTEAARHETPLFGTGGARFVGALVSIAAVVLGYYAVQDWRAALVRQLSNIKLTNGEFQPAMASADFAGQYALDPFLKLSAQMLSVDARAAYFAAVLQQTPQLPDSAFDVPRDALARLYVLKAAAPRFLNLSTLEWRLSLSLAQAYQRRNEQKIADEFFNNYVNALEQNRLDEPFNIQIIQRLWQARPNATPIDRLRWLKAYIRREWFDPSFIALVQDLGRMNGAAGALTDLIGIARADENRSPEQWNDRLSPETFRIAALVGNLTDQSTEAVKLAREAESMYKKAGPRLFSAHAAAIHEAVQYQFRATPAENTDAMLADLARASAIMGGPATSDKPLADAFGQTRLRILLAAGRAADAQVQLLAFAPKEESPLSTRLAYAYIDLADQFAETPLHHNLVHQWLQESQRLAPDLVETQWVFTRLYLNQSREAQAFDAAKNFLDHIKDRAIAYAMLKPLETRYPNSTLWSQLRAAYPDYPAAPESTSPQPSSQPATDH